MKRYFFSSLTRITSFTQENINFKTKPISEWKTGDYISCRVSGSPGTVELELPSGRLAEVAEGDIIIGSIGDRHATLEATGTWKKVKEDGKMQLISAAGLFGILTSKSTYLPKLIELDYIGHVTMNGEFKCMQDFVPQTPNIDFNTPVVLLVGTSMSAGKTTIAKVIIRQLKQAGLKVAAAKLSGTGRYRDLLGMYDAGADAIIDFVDAGLPSTVVPKEDYLIALKRMLSSIQQLNADVAVIEIGASPMEPYNGDRAIHHINKHVKFRVLCASDPYAVYGVMEAFGSRPDLISGIATNTIGGRDLIKKLVEVPSLNLIYKKNQSKLREMLSKNLKGVVHLNFTNTLEV
jgi:hypothetical protein